MSGPDATEPMPDMLSAYLDGELTAAEREAVEARLAASAEWRAELDEVRAARDALRGLPAREAPTGFWDAVHAHVAAADDDDGELDAASAVPITAARSRKRWAWLAAAAAAAAAVVAVIVVPHRAEVAPNVATVVAQHGAQGSDTNDPVSMLAPVGPLAGFRR
jgi:anti-sigma factor RsiW